MTLTHDIPTTVYEGDDVTFSVTAVGLTDLGTWDQGFFQVSVPGIFDIYDGRILGADGTISFSRPQAESGGTDIILSKRPFSGGERLSVTARQSVFSNACHYYSSGCPELFRIDILAGVDRGSSQKLQFLPAYITVLAGPRPASAGGAGAVARAAEH